MASSDKNENCFRHSPCYIFALQNKYCPQIRQLKLPMCRTVGGSFLESPLQVALQVKKNVAIFVYFHVIKGLTGPTDMTGKKFWCFYLFF